MIPPPTPRARTGGDAVLEALEREGVDVIFGYPGGTIMPFYDALYGHPMRHILVRHEAGAAFAAGGYARTSGRVGVCCATSGPGATNLVTGLVDAMMDSIPVVAITGQVRTALMGTDGFQEADVCAITQCTTKASILVTDPAQIYTKVREAFALARSGRPGPGAGRHSRPTCSRRPTCPSKARRARRATCVRWPRASRSRRRRKRSATRTGRWRSPAAARAIRKRWRRSASSARCWAYRIRRRSAGSEPRDPNDVHGLGMLGMHGTKAANLAVHAADVVLAFGMRFDDRVTGRPDRFAQDATIVHNDIDATEFNKIIPTAIALHGDSARHDRCDHRRTEERHRSALRRLGASQAEGARRPAAERRREGRPPLGDRRSSICSSRPAAEARSSCTDVGQHQMWAAQRVQAEHAARFLHLGGPGLDGLRFPGRRSARMLRAIRAGRCSRSSATAASR